MGQPYVGEIRIFAGNFAPVGWNFCDGSIQAINQNAVLFDLIGTTYGGDGVQTFQLPNLFSRFPVHMGTSDLGTSYVIGQNGGVEAVTLNTNQIPTHSHLPAAQSTINSSSQASPAGGVWANSSLGEYGSGAPASGMYSNALGQTGGSQPHNNMIPYQAINFIISLFGVFPTQ